MQFRFLGDGLSDSPSDPEFISVGRVQFRRGVATDVPDDAEWRNRWLVKLRGNSHFVEVPEPSPVFLPHEVEPIIPIAPEPAPAPRRGPGRPRKNPIA